MRLVSEGKKLLYNSSEPDNRKIEMREEFCEPMWEQYLSVGSNNACRRPMMNQEMRSLSSLSDYDSDSSSECSSEDLSESETSFVSNEEMSGAEIFDKEGSCCNNVGVNNLQDGKPECLNRNPSISVIDLMQSRKYNLDRFEGNIVEQSTMEAEVNQIQEATAQACVNELLSVLGGESCEMQSLFSHQRSNSVSSLSSRKSAMKKADSKHKSRGSVTFSKLKIREFTSIAISDNPSCSHGPPIQLGWEYQDRKAMDVDRYEENRKPRRRPSQMVMPYHVRRHLLLHEAGYTKAEVAETVKEVDRVRRERMLADIMQPENKVNETLQDIVGSFQQIFSLGGL